MFSIKPLLPNLNSCIKTNPSFLFFFLDYYEAILLGFESQNPNSELLTQKAEIINLKSQI